MIETASRLRAQFEERGFLDPVRVFPPAACPHVLRRLRKPRRPPLDWSKGAAATSHAFYELATRPALLDRVASLLGDDVLLWGASLVERPAGHLHPWHSDIETCLPAGRTVNVWIGLDGTDAGSSLRLVLGSHRYGLPLQQSAARHGARRGAAKDEDVLAWARERDPAGRIVQPALGDGEALFFDGRLWHGSHNTHRRGKRTALLLQYATPDAPLRIPDFSVLEWPFRFLAAPRPPCIMVRGSDSRKVNRIVPPPPPPGSSSSASWIHPLTLPLAQDPQVGWKPHPIFRGPTTQLSDLGCHASVLDPGKTPHEPHVHDEEEILVMLNGEADLVIVDDEMEGERAHTLRAGSLVYYPAQQRHTIRNAGTRPATYLMFKWRAEEARAAAALGTLVLDLDEKTRLPAQPGREGFEPRLVFEGPTRYLGKLHCHRSTLAPGAGYPPHVDAYDVAIVVLEGTVETLGQEVGPMGVVFFAAGEPHGMSNVGPEPASYLVFEFHGGVARPPRERSRWRRWRRRLLGR